MIKSGEMAAYKIDLHTHSKLSPDGALGTKDYVSALDNGDLDFIAITDHNEVSFAQDLQRQIGGKIIVGEEITTSEGHLIGLFLKSKIESGMNADETADAIHAQGGLVYAPHPFELKTRRGLGPEVLNTMSDKIDIVEIHNARGFKRTNDKALKWAKEHNKAMAASSDAHGSSGFGQACSYVKARPDENNLVEYLQWPDVSTEYAGMVGRVTPKLNRFRKIFRG